MTIRVISPMRFRFNRGWIIDPTSLNLIREARALILKIVKNMRIWIQSNSSLNLDPFRVAGFGLPFVVAPLFRDFSLLFFLSIHS